MRKPDELRGETCAGCEFDKVGLMERGVRGETRAGTGMRTSEA